MRWFWPFFVCFILVSCGIAQSSKTSELMNTPPSLAYLALGDSYTIGEGVNEFERWP
ncbi:MAG: Lysophospholipase, partial [Bacteroidetes bacterium]|nr:Lysophospholipase [Bacteroidota bacterium]